VQAPKEVDPLLHLWRRLFLVPFPCRLAKGPMLRRHSLSEPEVGLTAALGVDGVGVGKGPKDVVPVNLQNRDRYQISDTEVHPTKAWMAHVKDACSKADLPAGAGAGSGAAGG
jgi:hypothetical protein